MHDQRSEDEDSEGRLGENADEKAVLELLLCDAVPWTVEEIVREVSCTRVDAVDAVARLVAAGLLHRCGEFVFLTRTARRADEIGIS